MTLRTAGTPSPSGTFTGKRTKITGRSSQAQSTQTSFGQTLQSLLGKHAQSSRVNEEELFAGAICHQLKERYGSEFSGEFKTVFKLSMIGNSSPNRHASPEKSAKEALRFLVQSGKLTVEQAREIRQVAFQAAQIDSNLNKLYDSHNGNNDGTIATARFGRAQQMVAARLASVAESTVKSSKSAPARGSRLDKEL